MLQYFDSARHRRHSMLCNSYVVHHNLTRHGQQFVAGICIEDHHSCLYYGLLYIHMWNAVCVFCYQPLSVSLPNNLGLNTLLKKKKHWPCFMPCVGATTKLQTCEVHKNCNKEKKTAFAALDCTHFLRVCEQHTWSTPGCPTFKYMYLNFSFRKFYTMKGPRSEEGRFYWVHEWFKIVCDRWAVAMIIVSRLLLVQGICFPRSYVTVYIVNLWAIYSLITVPPYGCQKSVSMAYSTVHNLSESKTACL